ncbi:MAG TPA: hypothetical protein VFR31_02395, partial [Thermoanaerobaculia bacterium]|nr:hypothetical protein [Thermoanaerobaculia bacterium]
IWLPLVALALLPSRGDDACLFALFSLPALALAQWGFLEILEYRPRPWYFLAFLAVAALALDVRLSSSTLGRIARLGAAGLATLVLILPATTAAQTRMSNVDLVADRIAAEAAPGDLVVIAPWYMGISYQRYARGPAPWMTVPDLPDHSIHRFDLLKDGRVDLGAIERTLRSGGRVWVVGRLDISPPKLTAFLSRHAVRREARPVPWNGPVNGYERLDLLAFSGWRTSG